MNYSFFNLPCILYTYSEKAQLEADLLFVSASRLTCPFTPAGAGRFFLRNENTRHLQDLSPSHRCDASMAGSSLAPVTARWLKKSKGDGGVSWRDLDKLKMIKVLKQKSGGWFQTATFLLNRS